MPRFAALVKRLMFQRRCNPSQSGFLESGVVTRDYMMYLMNKDLLFLWTVWKQK